MARQVMEKLYADFRKGWLQDQHPLQQPEGTVKDITNFDIAKDGTLSKRKGIVAKSVLSENLVPDSRNFRKSIEMFKWESVNGDPSFDITVLHIYSNQSSRFYFFNSEPLSSASAVGSYIGLKIIPQETNQGDLVSYANALGRLFVSHPGYGTYVFKYDTTTGNINEQQINLQMRDTTVWGEGLYADHLIGVSNYKLPQPLPGRAEYNLRNSGWGDQPVKCASQPWDYRTHDAKFPPIPYYFYEMLTEYNTVKWPRMAELYPIGKQGGGGSPNEITAFAPANYHGDYAGTTIPPIGKYIVDVKQFSRTGYLVHGLTHGMMAEKANQDFPVGASDTYTLSEHPSKIAFYAGRLWYAGNGTYDKEIDARSTIYYSQSLQTSIENAGKCYQKNDPTAETINQVLATDGGTLRLKEIGKIHELLPMGPSLFVLAENGIWRISGKDYNSFSAESYSIEKIVNVGVKSPRSATANEDTVFAVTEVGILAINTQSSYGGVQVTNLTESKINTFYRKFSSKVLRGAKLKYDFKEKRLVCIAAIPDNQGVPNSFYETNYNTVLFFDIELGSFYKYTFNLTEDLGNNEAVTGIFFTEGIVSTPIEEDVVDSLGEVYTDSAGEDYYIPAGSTSVEVLKRVGLVMSRNYDVSLLVFEDDTNYEDELIDSSYSASVELGFDSIGSLLADKKQAPYIVSYMERPYKIDPFGDKQYTGFVTEEVVG